MNKEDAMLNLRAAILEGLVTRAHLTGMRAGKESDMIIDDVVAALTAPSVARVVIEALQLLEVEHE